MANKLEQLIEEAKKVKLPIKAKLEIGSVLTSFVDYHPLRRPPIASSAWPGRFLWRLQPVASALLLVALVGGGISWAAEGAVPGDWLYSIKINVNEGLRSLVAVLPQEKVNWQAERVERRLVEATQLSLSGRLDSKKREVVEAGLEQHLRDFETGVEALEQKQEGVAATRANSSLEVSLKNHEKILTDIAAEKKELEPEIRPLVQKVRQGVTLVAREKTDVVTATTTATSTISATDESGEPGGKEIKTGAGDEPSEGGRKELQEGNVSAPSAINFSLPFQ